MKQAGWGRRPARAGRSEVQSGVGGPGHGVAVPERGPLRRVDANGFAVHAATDGLADEGIELRHGLARGPCLTVLGDPGDLAQLDGVAADEPGDLVEIHVGLVVSPGRVEDMTQLQGVRYLPLGPLFGTKRQGAGSPLEEAPDHGGAALRAGDGVVPVGLGGPPAERNGRKPAPLALVEVDDGITGLVADLHRALWGVVLARHRLEISDPPHVEGPFPN